ncbi:MAG: ABC transporter ATP-binding protein, partial [Methyloligellaceae bacterium]
MTVLISAQNLEKKFGEIHAVKDISLDVQKGEVLGFLGPNGAGKSTTMKMITGFLTPDSGTAEICGFDIVKEPIEAKRRIGYLPEGAPLYSDMTPHSFLNFIADIHGIDKSIRADRIADSVAKTGLEPVYNQVIDTLSKGFKRRVGLAQAILNDPDVLILDEPTDGLDPNQKHLVRELISTMAKEKAIIISTHILEEVEAVCSRAVVIDQGRVIVDGTADELQGRSSHYNAVTLKTA